MTVFLLDTNIVVRAMKRREPAIDQHMLLAESNGDLLALSVLTIYELRVGVLRNVNPESAERKLKTFLRLVSAIWEFEETDALLAADIRAGLMRSGSVIGNLDLLIAAQALRRNVTVVTNNVREFSRIPGLGLEDWTLP